MIRSASPQSEVRSKRRCATMDDRILRGEPEPTPLSTPRSHSLPARFHRTYWNDRGSLEWQSQDGVAFKIQPTLLYDALPKLQLEDRALSRASARLNFLPATTAEIILDLIYSVETSQLSDSCEVLGAMAFCKRYGGEVLVDTLRPYAIRGTDKERSGHYAIWSFTLGDDLRDLELLRAGARASLRIADLTTNLSRGYFDSKPVSPPAIIALTRIHLNRINAAHILLTSSSTLASTTASHETSCPTFAALRTSWSSALLSLRRTVGPDFDPSILLVHSSLFGNEGPQCEDCRKSVEKAVEMMQEKWRKVPDGSELEPTWWR
ncbi:hypothetical protein P7C70_g7554, partial [Phenoliferia sp. Uapishka_3]